MALPQIRSVVSIIDDLDCLGTQQILVLNKADAMAADKELASRWGAMNWEEVDERFAPCSVVATSALDGRGLGKLKAAIEAALLRMAIEIDCVVPYAQAALVAEVRATSTISAEEYVEEGTRVVAYVPVDLRNRLATACAAAETPFSAADAPATSSKPPSKPRKKAAK